MCGTTTEAVYIVGTTVTHSREKLTVIWKNWGYC